MYPLPHPSGHGLGVHLDKDNRRQRACSDQTIRYQARKDDYENDRLCRSKAFVESARLFLPTLSVADVMYGEAESEPELHPPEESFADFLLRHDTNHPRLIQAAGIDSPGLTSCLAIAAALSGSWCRRLSTELPGFVARRLHTPGMRAPRASPGGASTPRTTHLFTGDLNPLMAGLKACSYNDQLLRTTNAESKIARSASCHEGMTIPCDARRAFDHRRNNAGGAPSGWLIGA